MALTSALAAAADAIYRDAIACETGLIVRTNHVMRAKAMFYTYRKELGNPDYMFIQIRISPTNPETDLWFIRMKEVQIDE